jgi:hypothetical protein
MSNYTKTTNFGAKDTLPSGDRYGVRYEELLAFVISAL